MNYISDIVKFHMKLKHTFVYRKEHVKHEQSKNYRESGDIEATLPDSEGADRTIK